MQTLTETDTVEFAAMHEEIVLQQNLAEYLTGNMLQVVESWLATAVAGWETNAPARQSFYIQQAKRLLSLFIEGAQRDSLPTELSPEREATLRHDFPLVYTEAMLAKLASVVMQYIIKQPEPIPITDGQIVILLMHGFAASSIAPHTQDTPR